MDIKEALDLEFEDRDIGPTTIRGYMKELLAALLSQEESFSGKRPFGNSGWHGGIAFPLIKAGLLKGEIDEDDYAHGYDDDEYEELLMDLVEAL
jgi:hypothetical protein